MNKKGTVFTIPPVHCDSVTTWRGFHCPYHLYPTHYSPLTTSVRRQRFCTGVRGSSAALRSHTLMVLHTRQAHTYVHTYCMIQKIHTCTYVRTRALHPKHTIHSTDTSKLTARHAAVWALIRCASNVALVSTISISEKTTVCDNITITFHSFFNRIIRPLYACPFHVRTESEWLQNVTIPWATDRSDTGKTTRTFVELWTSVVELALPLNSLTESSENVVFYYRSVGWQDCTTGAYVFLLFKKRSFPSFYKNQTLTF